MVETMITSAGVDLQRFKPRNGRLVVHLDVGMQVSPGGIYLPPEAQEIRSTGRVLAVDPECTEFQPGMHVLVDNHAGLPLGNLKNTPVNLYKPENIQAILEECDQ